MVYTTPNGNFLNYDSEISVPTGDMTLDKDTLPTNDRNRYVLYMPNNTHRYGVRYYMIVGSIIGADSAAQARYAVLAASLCAGYW